MKSTQDIFERACSNGCLEIVKICAENGANIYKCKEWALRYSIKYNHYEVVKFLLDKGADPYDSYWGELDSFQIASFYNKNNILKLLNQYK